MNNMGTGPTLREASPWLQNEAERHERILDVTERNSVIEGLPPFDPATREKIRLRLKSISAATPQSAPPE
jgi:hypothetical protein